MANHEAFRERILYYWARLYSQNLQSGDEYNNLRPVVSVIFTDFPIYAGNPDILYDSFKITSQDDPSRVYSNHFRILFMTIPHDLTTSGGPVGSDPFKDPRLRDWLLALNYPKRTSEEEMEDIAARNPMIGSALTKAKHFMAEPEVQMYMEAKSKFEHNQASIQGTIARKNFAEGKAEGIAEGMIQGKIEEKISSIKAIIKMRFHKEDLSLDDFLARKTADELQKIFNEAVISPSYNDFLNQFKEEN